MTFTNAIDKRQAKFQFFLISACIHLIAFIFMGMFVLHSERESRESVNVALLSQIEETRKLRHNILKPHNSPIYSSTTTKVSQDIVRPQIMQEFTSEYVPTEETPVFQREYVVADRPDLNIGGSVKPPEVKISKPAVTRKPIHNPQEAIFEIYDDMSHLSLPQISLSIPERRISDPSILQDFLRMVSRQIEKSKNYPRWAREAGFEGKVVVRFTILQNGALDREPQLVHSSGSDVLDSAAITAIKEAAPFPALPDSLRKEQIHVELPMNFRLQQS